MNGVDPRAFEFALSKIEDGMIFEKFAFRFLSCVLEYNFIPVGGFKDRGIDGLEHLYHRESYEKNIYQVSIDKNCVGKLENTLKTLKRNKIIYSQLFYVTNQIFPDIDRNLDKLIETYKKHIYIFDRNWFSARVNTSTCTINAYTILLESYLHEFNVPSKS